MMILNHRHSKWLTECHKNIIIQALKVCIKIETIKLKAIVRLSYRVCKVSGEEDALLGMALGKG